MVVVDVVVVCERGFWRWGAEGEVRAESVVDAGGGRGAEGCGCRGGVWGVGD